MKLNLGRTFMLTLAVGGAMLTGPAQAQALTYLYIAHAASGRNVSATANPAMPVDVSVNSNCIEKGLSFGDINGPFTGPAGSFTFKVTMANTISPCSGSTVFSAPVTLAAGGTYLGIITLNAANAPIGQIYPLNLAPIPGGQARFDVVNTTLQNLNASITAISPGGLSGKLSIPASSLKESGVIAGLYTGTVTDSSAIVRTGPISVEIVARNQYLYVLAGSVTNNSVQVSGPKLIRGVF